jgi:hypothetical protein
MPMGDEEDIAMIGKYNAADLQGLKRFTIFL